MKSVIERWSKKASRKGLSAFLCEQLGSAEGGSRVLNVGAGGEIQVLVNGVAKRRNFTVTHTDIDAARSPDAVDDITHSSFGDGTFDVVVMMEVLEHVPEPMLAISEIERLLRPGGRLILSTPFIFPLHDRPYDFYRYTRYGLAYLLRTFADVSIRERNSWAEALLVLPMRLSKEPGRRQRAAAVLMFAFSVLIFPVAFLFGKLAPSNYITTGYVVSAVRPGEQRVSRRS